MIGFFVAWLRAHCRLRGATGINALRRRKKIKRTIHGPAIERDATGRRESRAGSQCLAWNVKWSMASRRLSFRPEFGTQLEADMLIPAETEGHLVCTLKKKAVSVS